MAWPRGGAAGRALLRRLSGGMAADVAWGALLTLSPWLFGGSDRVLWPHLVAHLREAGAWSMTRAASENAAGRPAAGGIDFGRSARRDQENRGAST